MNHKTQGRIIMQVSNASNSHARSLAMHALRQAQQMQQQMAEQTIQMSQAKESVENGQKIAGLGTMLDVYM